MVHKFGLIHLAIHHSCKLIVLYLILSVWCYEQTSRSFDRDRNNFEVNSGNFILPSYILVFCFITAVGCRIQWHEETTT
jgi:hypothetical protein